ncbi:MAG: sporulation protein YabP [Clostridia bacterium]|nr:sporulation protein YabP [Clostridia bacterium]
MAQTENDRALNGQNAREGHNVIITRREKIELTGVCEVISFDENTVVMQTLDGNLTVDGTEMNVTGLDLSNGRVTVSGRLVGLYYIEQKGKRRMFGR